MIRSLFLSALVLGTFTAGAATPYKKSLTVKKNQYVNDGVFIGGKASKGATLINVRRSHSAKAKIERVIVDVAGDPTKNVKDKMPFFQASIDSQSRRVVLDLAQLRMSRVTEIQLKNMFKQSPYVQDVSLTFDPEDKGATMVLELKQPMRLEVFQLVDKKKPARVVMDLVPRSVRR